MTGYQERALGLLHGFGLLAPEYQGYIGISLSDFSHWPSYRPASPKARCSHGRPFALLC